MSFDLSNPNRAIHVGVVLMNGETEILDVAPIDLLNGLSKKFALLLPIPDELKAQALDFEFHWVNEKGGPAKLTSGITMQATDSFATCPPLDIVLMGAHMMDYQPNEAELAYVRKAYEESSAFLSICGGMFVPLQAGILKDKTATGPRFIIPGLQQSNPEVKWVEKRFVRDGKVWTSGALLNGLDLMTAFAEETWGKERGLVKALIDIGSWPERSVEYGNVR